MMKSYRFYLSQTHPAAGVLCNRFVYYGDETDYVFCQWLKLKTASFINKATLVAIPNSCVKRALPNIDWDEHASALWPLPIKLLK